MDADSNAAVLAAAGDRLSRLNDAALGHILSFVPATEAARAALLSRRWRHLFSAVHTLSFREAEEPLSIGYQWFKIRPGRPNDVRAPRFVTGVAAALLGRDRIPRAPAATSGAGAAAAPMRALRVAFDEFGFLGGDAWKAIDAWLSYAAYHAAGDLEIDLRLDCSPVCGRQYILGLPFADVEDDGADQPPELATMDDHDMEEALPVGAAAGERNPGRNEYITPKSVFSFTTLRTLRLGGCWLDLPSAIALPSLATLHLTRVTGRCDAIQQLVTACQSLADLTLEACGGNNLTELAVPGAARLRRLALRCCHELAAVAVGDSSEMRAFEYRGGVPEGPLFLSMQQPSKIKLCTLDFCGEEPNRSLELGFLQLFAGVERLHLTSARLGRGVFDHRVFSCAQMFPVFPALRNLELTGMLPGDDIATVGAVTSILERTPSLETMSLFFLPEPHPVTKDMGAYANDHADEEMIHAAHKLRYDRHATLSVPGVEIPCLKERTREINFVHYQGAMAQRMLANFLLGNALVLDEICCEFARGPLSIQTKLMEEMKGWVLNKSANIVFL